MMHYNLSASSHAAYKRWGALEPLDAGMIAMKEAVAKAIDKGLFYSSHVFDEVAPQFDFTPEELARERGYVERGVVGMEIYYARRAVEADRAAIAEAEAKARLALNPGDKIGPVSMVIDSKRRRLRNCRITGVGDWGYAFEGTSGNKRWKIQARAVSLEAGMKRGAA